MHDVFGVEVERGVVKVYGRGRTTLNRRNLNLELQIKCDYNDDP